MPEAATENQILTAADIYAGMRVIGCVYSLQRSAPSFECTSSEPPVL